MTFDLGNTSYCSQHGYWWGGGSCPGCTAAGIPASGGNLFVTPQPVVHNHFTTVDVQALADKIGELAEAIEELDQVLLPFARLLGRVRGLRDRFRR